MSRPLRIEFPNATYHVMNRGLASQAVFTDPSDRQQFLALLGECHAMWGIRVIAYCLLDNHYHVLIQTPQANLSRVMRHLDGVYTQRYNRRHKRDGPLFRGRYKAIVVEAEEYLLAVTRYIHHNPVAAGLVRFPEEYAWGSCRLYMGDGRRPGWLDTDQVLGRFPQKDRLRAFRDFMRSKIEEPVKVFYEGQRGKPVLGSKGFIEKMGSLVRKRSMDLKEIPEARSYGRPDQQSCLLVVRRVYGCEEADLMRSRRGQRNEGRAMAIYLCRKVAGMKHDEIAKRFRVGGYSAVSSVVGRVQAELEKGGPMARRYEAILSELQRQR